MSKKEQEMNEIHRAIWAIANDLRGAVDGWDFKSYVLGTLFYKYISENLTHYINEQEDEDFDYVKLNDEEVPDFVKKDLIEEFYRTTNLDISNIGDTWTTFIKNKMTKELDELIQSENLKQEAAETFIKDCLAMGEVKTTGPELRNIMPRMSRFDKNSSLKKEQLTNRLCEFIEKYNGLISD